MDLVHPPSPRPSPKRSPRRPFTEPGMESHATITYPRGFQCEVCHEACLSQTELEVHVVTVHSCPICHDGIYMDMRDLEEHLEQHRSPYACRLCGLSYAEEAELLEHYKDSPNDIHPHCERCCLGFENKDTYSAVSISFINDGSQLSVRFRSMSMKPTHGSLVRYVKVNYSIWSNSLSTTRIRGNIPSARNVGSDSETNLIIRT